MTFLAAFIVWCAIWWRFRGGAFTTITGINPGTNGMRAIACAMIAAPLLYLNHHYLIILSLWVALTVGLMLTGWEEFQMMGVGGSLETEKPGFWMRKLPNLLGLKMGTVLYDSVGMGEAGVVAMFPATFALAFWFGIPSLRLLVVGSLFWLPYVIARFVPFPTIPRFAQGASWGEIFVGMLVGAGLLCVFNS